jgi:hypothetical protein
MMITRYLLATAAVAFAGAVAAFTAVAFAGAAAAFGATPPVAGGAAPPALSSDAVPGQRGDAMRAKLMDMDTDHDGRWSKAEWLAGGRNAKGFDRMDANHDGYLTPDELRTGMAAMRAARVQDMPLPPAAGAPE